MGSGGSIAILIGWILWSLACFWMGARWQDDRAYRVWRR